MELQYSLVLALATLGYSCRASPVGWNKWWRPHRTATPVSRKQPLNLVSCSFAIWGHYFGDTTIRYLRTPNFYTLYWAVHILVDWYCAVWQRCGMAKACCIVHVYLLFHMQACKWNLQQRLQQLRGPAPQVLPKASFSNSDISSSNFYVKTHCDDPCLL